MQLLCQENVGLLISLVLHVQDSGLQQWPKEFLEKTCVWLLLAPQAIRSSTLWPLYPIHLSKIWCHHQDVVKYKQNSTYDVPTKRRREMGLYVSVAEKFVTRNYMQPQSERVKPRGRLTAPYTMSLLRQRVSDSRPAGSATDCLAQRGKPSYR